MVDPKVTVCLYGCGWEYQSLHDEGAIMLLDHLLVCPVWLSRVAEVDRQNEARLAAYRAKPRDKGSGHFQGKYS